MVFRIVGILLLVLAAISVRCQTYQLKAGYTRATIDSYAGYFGDDTGTKMFGSISGFYFTLSKDIALAPWVALQPGIGYSKEGFAADGHNHVLHYVQMPVYFNFRVRRIGGILFGPQVNALIRAPQIEQGFNSSKSDFPAYSIVNVSAVVAPYVRITDRLALELRASFGLNPIIIRSLSVADWYQFALHGGLAFNFGRRE